MHDPVRSGLVIVRVPDFYTLLPQSLHHLILIARDIHAKGAAVARSSFDTRIRDSDAGDTPGFNLRKKLGVADLFRILGRVLRLY